MRPSRILVLGNHRCSYRSAEVVHGLLADPDRFRVHLLDPLDGAGYGMAVRIAHLWLGIIHAMCWAEVIYITPMQHGATRSMRMMLRLLRLLRKREVCDYYVSLHESAAERHADTASDAALAPLLTDDRKALARGDPVIFLNRSEADHYQAIASQPVPPARTAIVPLIVPERPQATLPYARSRSQRLTLYWWGRLNNPIHGLECILAAMDRAIAAQPDGFSLVLAVEGSRDEINALRAAALHRPSASAISILTDTTFRDGGLADRIVNEADAALGIFGGSAKARTVVANKVFDAMSFGVPCITGSSRGVAELFEPDEIVTCPHDPESLAASLLELHRTPDRLEAIGLRGRSAVRDRYGRAAFHAAIRAIVAQPS
jgi:glycosyltransferase involved in cell wall biosynthesis